MTRRLRFATARQVFDAFPAARDDIESEPADVEPLTFLQSLLNGPTPEDGIGFCAYLLPRREAVWWACQCIRTMENPVCEADENLLNIAESWVKEPEETNREAALGAGSNANVRNSATWAVLAAAWSGGSMVPGREQAVPPPAHLTAQAVRAAVLTSLARVAIKERRQYLGGCINAAIRLIDSNGGEVR